MRLVKMAGHHVVYETDHGDYERWDFNGESFATRADYDKAVKAFQDFLASLAADLVVVAPLHFTRIPFPKEW